MAERTWEWEAREQIRDLVARYNANGDSGRLDAVMELFARDALLNLEDRQYRGVDQIRRMFDTAATGTRLERAKTGSFIRHFTATHQIDLIDPRQATGRCYFQVLTQEGLDHWGRYLDEYARHGDRWQFRSRSIHVDGRIPGGWSDRTEARLREPDP
jgi:hypothetical protein